VKLTLAKALSYKKRVAGWIAKVNDKVQSSNSAVQGEEREEDIRALVQRREALVNHLIDLKVAVAQANAPIVGKIFRLSESKTEVDFWNGINTNHGTSASSYYGSGDAPVYEAEVRRQEADQNAARLETQIDTIQSELDTFNHNTTIDIPDLD